MPVPPALLLGVKNCYAQYSEDGCSVCLSRVEGMYECGWCSNIQSCVEGGISGPLHGECHADEWMFNKSRCDDSFCATFDDRRNCKSPCKWSYRQEKCILLKNYELSDSLSRAMIFVITAIAVLLVVEVIVILAYCGCFENSSHDVGDYEIWMEVNQ